MLSIAVKQYVIREQHATCKSESKWVFQKFDLEDNRKNVSLMLMLLGLKEFENWTKLSSKGRGITLFKESPSEIVFI